MKDMFYNYDYNLDKKTYPEPLIWHDCHGHAVAFAGGAVPLTNAKGDVLGLLAKRNSDFDIYFTLDDLCGDEMIARIMDSEIICNILAKDHKVLLSPEVIKYDNHTLIAKVHASDDTIPYGVYRVELYAKVIRLGVEPVKYTLFAENDGILSIG